MLPRACAPARVPGGRRSQATPSAHRRDWMRCTRIGAVRSKCAAVFGVTLSTRGHGRGARPLAGERLNRYSRPDALARVHLPARRMPDHGKMRLSPPPPAEHYGKMPSLMNIGASLAKLLWRVLALVLVALGLLGVLLPVLPTVPFLLAAAWASARGWPALARWLVEHPRYGEYIRCWQQEGAVPRRAKWAASAMMAFSALVLLVVNAPVAAKVGVLLLLTGIATWLWTRPEP